MSLKWKIVVIIVVQTLVLVGMVAKKQYTLSIGTSIILETQPIDPRSLFQGDYVRLNYKISEIKYNTVTGDKDFKKHDTIYVLLKKGNPYWTAVSVHHNLVSAPADHVVIKGEVKYTGTRSWRDNEEKDIFYLEITYGIENYFVPEGEGRELERPEENTKVTIQVMVDQMGNAGIKAVLLNGKERYVETLF